MSSYKYSLLVVTKLVRISKGSIPPFPCYAGEQISEKPDDYICDCGDFCKHSPGTPTSFHNITYTTIHYTPQQVPLNLLQK